MAFSLAALLAASFTTEARCRSGRQTEQAPQPSRPVRWPKYFKILPPQAVAAVAVEGHLTQPVLLAQKLGLHLLRAGPGGGLAVVDEEVAGAHIPAE